MGAWLLVVWFVGITPPGEVHIRNKTQDDKTRIEFKTKEECLSQAKDDYERFFRKHAERGVDVKMACIPAEDFDKIQKELKKVKGVSNA